MRSIQLVAFRLSREEYAVTIEKVREIINYVPVTRLPGTPAYFEGVINVRGKIVPVVDFMAKMGLPATDQANKQIVIVETRDKEVGLTVDSVTEVIRTVPENFASVETEGSRQGPREVYKFQNRIIILLDIDQVLSTPALAG
jgi:purine-binding chemotaxis protein CheW